MQRGALFGLCLCVCLLFVLLHSSVALAKTTPSSTPMPVTIQAKTSESATSSLGLGTINWTEPPIITTFILLAGKGVSYLLKCMLEKSTIRRKKYHQQNKNLTIYAKEYDERLHKECALNTWATIDEHDISTRLLALLLDDSATVEMKRSVQHSVALVFGSLVSADNVPAILRLLANQQLDESVRRGIIEALSQLITKPQHGALLAERWPPTPELSDDTHSAL